MALHSYNFSRSAYSKLLEYLNPLFNRRMRCKQTIQTIQKAHRLFARMLDKQLGNICPIYGFFRKALANANGFRVISAAPASARYSRLREMANRIKVAKK